MKDEIPSNSQLREAFNLAIKKLEAEENTLLEEKTPPLLESILRICTGKQQAKQWGKRKFTKSNALKKHIERWK